MKTLARMAAAGALLATSTVSAQATQAQAKLAAAMKGANHIALADAMTTASASGKPISARYEFEDGKVQLTVFVEKAGAFSEVFVDHMTGKVVKTDKITSGDDMKEAKDESKASAKMTGTLAAVVAAALAANPGYTAIDVSPVAQGKDKSVASITLMKDGKFKGVTLPLP
jgi:archaellum component FlaG (FlaF/FlaG flagellin family)